MSALSGQVIDGIELKIEWNYKDDQPAPRNTFAPPNIL